MLQKVLNERFDYNATFLSLIICLYDLSTLTVFILLHACISRDPLNYLMMKKKKPDQNRTILYHKVVSFYLSEAKDLENSELVELFSEAL